MTQKKEYYGTDDNSAVSYLEYGSIDLENKSKKIWGYWQDQEAYDLYMFARYARDLFSFREFIKGPDYSLESFLRTIEASAHDKLLDYVFKYAGIRTACKCNCIDGGGYICESGSSLYGLIDESIACDMVFNNGGNSKDIESMHYVASDISEMMNEGAATFHPGTEVVSTLAPTVGDLVLDLRNRLNIRLAMFYGLGVSIRYAIRSASDYANMADVCDLQVYNRISFCHGKSRTSVYGTGKTVYIISIEEFVDTLKKNGLYAMYCTGSMQFNRDGEDSIRASMIISRDKTQLESFIELCDSCIDMCRRQKVCIDTYEWKDIEALLVEAQR